MGEAAESAVLGPAHVLREELQSLGYIGIPETKNAAEVHAWIHDLPDDERPVALCLSGGGIRSATFGLGVLQALARHRVLEKIHYLSTVSGGGYIGGWLTAWLTRSSPAAVVEQLTASDGPDEPEPPEVCHLRDYTNYLNPRLGWLSADTWTLIATYVRNLLLNWAILLPLLLAILAVPRLAVALSGSKWPGAGPGATSVSVLGYVALVWALAYVVVFSHWTKIRSRQDRAVAFFVRQSGFLAFCLLPLALSAIVFALTWAWASNTGARGWTPITFLQAHGLAPASSVADWADLYACFTVPALLVGFLLIVTAYVGLTNRFRWSTDEDLEWWARLGAWVLIAALVWLASVVVIFGPTGAVWIWDQRGWLVNAALGALGLGSGSVAVFGGKSGRTSAAPATTERKLDGRLAAWLLSKATVVAAPIFIVFLVAALSMLTNVLLAILGRALNRYPLGLDWGNTVLPSASWHELIIFDASPALVGAFILIVLVATIAAALLVNINKFSLHAMYRNRLIRAYLGASNPDRRPDWFTGFDDRDNVQMYELAVDQPLHVVNIALNLVDSRKLAWQERKAESFTVSRLHAGSAALGYRRSATYGSNKPGTIGISLGTAMAISGAAASPNMGYHSSPAVTFLMTLFNARLGWWLGNPGPAGARTHERWGPRFAIGPMLAEMFGLTDDARRYVYLSDGGHFENLGLYEMVARRCGTIVVVDAGCDPACVFEDLGNAVRKIRVDLGIPIEFPDPLQIYARKPERQGVYHAIGTIHYETVDPNGRPGRLLYIKPCFYRAKEPIDVRNYADAHGDFPHEPTTDQWFSESQFESYRALGLHVTDTVLATNGVRQQIGI